MSVVVDLSVYGVTPYEITFSMVGIMGTQYVRNGSVPSKIFIEQGSTEVLNVNYIYSKHVIGDELQIQMRVAQGQDIATLENKQGHSTITIDPGFVDGGTYDLVLESWNDLSPVKSVLRRDVIQVTVEELPPLPHLPKELPQQTVISTQARCVPIADFIDPELFDLTSQSFETDSTQLRDSLAYDNFA